MIDYYGIRPDWPGYQESKKMVDHAKRAKVMNSATEEEVQRLFTLQNRAKRFISYVSMHEIEALYFSDVDVLATHLGVDKEAVDAILDECGEPEKINDSSKTAPSKRLMALSNRFKKISTGVAIAEEIGMSKMRRSCPLFNGWLEKLESLG